MMCAILGSTTGCDSDDVDDIVDDIVDVVSPFDNSAMGVSYPTGFQDWTVIGMTRRPSDTQMRVVVGNTTAAEAARGGRPESWPDGSILVDIVWSEIVNPSSVDTIGPNEFTTIAVMEKGSAKWAETGGWGYGFWSASEGLAPSGKLVDPNAADDTTTCFGCHNVRVPDKDFVFTEPLVFPTDAQIASAPVANNGTVLPTGVLGWRLLGVHYRNENQEMRLILGNDIAVDAWRAGTVDPTWPDGTKLADIVFASTALATTDTPNETDMASPGDFKVLAFMERGTNFADTDDWSYVAWGLDDAGMMEKRAESVPEDATDMMTCYGCHKLTVTEKDFVFTQPGKLPGKPPPNLP
ncbi:MAG: cytochrome P460 family protein [Myxococcales bacterium]|nr:cytochrome P460 family protein [Myxococcales bacterium]